MLEGVTKTQPAERDSGFKYNETENETETLSDQQVRPTSICRRNSTSLPNIKLNRQKRQGPWI